MTDWWHDPDPKPDGWTRGEWLAVLVLPLVALVALVFVRVLQELGRL